MTLPISVTRQPSWSLTPTMRRPKYLAMRMVALAYTRYAPAPRGSRSFYRVRMLRSRHASGTPRPAGVRRPRPSLRTLAVAPPRLRAGALAAPPGSLGRTPPSADRTGITSDRPVLRTAPGSPGHPPTPAPRTNLPPLRALVRRAAMPGSTPFAPSPAAGNRSHASVLPPGRLLRSLRDPGIVRVRR